MQKNYRIFSMLSAGKNSLGGCFFPIILSAMLASWLPLSVMGQDTATPQPVEKLAGDIFPHGVDSTGDTPIPGLFEIVSGTTVVYVSGNGRFVIEGDIFDLEDGKNLTEKKRNLARKEIIDSVDEKSLIVFAPDNARHTITVFTDVDCGYCRKLHKEVNLLNEAGIAVRYLGFPRAGPDSGTYGKMAAVWCAKDRKKAMTDAKNGKPVPASQCDHPLDEHLAIGRKIGVRGTPAILLEDGSLISGYLPAARLRKVLEKSSP
uniref:Thiol:disulfide interchange protein n=1 Tax=Candidatus Kentrum sp. DK TaxID=2126562 RepID=A0A450THQ5_9GAMM|nr:MAG: Thiol:disulfide interchange protein DsbC [Candidatus Kentron sp. DK]